MSRNGSGVYTVVNTFVSGNPVTAAGHNQNWSDLATEITNSVAADGQTTMSGPLKAASGTAAAPGLTFASDPDSGIYRKASNIVGIACGGALAADFQVAGATLQGSLNALGTLQQKGFDLLPVGVIFPYGGSAAPSGYLLCFGQSLLRASYPDLFTAIGTTYGAADGTHFTLPDLRGRVVAGKDDMGGSSANRLTNADNGLNGDTLGATGGLETKTLSTGNLPPYTPAGTNSAGAATLSTTTNSFQGGGTNAITTVSAGGAISTTFTQPTFTGTAQGGASTPFGIVQPTFILNYIIFAGV